jgi:RNA polymerase sigma-70 factor (ECF subfamily)
MSSAIAFTPAIHPRSAARFRHRSSAQPEIAASPKRFARKRTVKALTVLAETPKPSERLQRKPDSASLFEIVRLAQSGDAVAFETIYQLHSRRVYALCLRMLGDPTEAEDLAQEAFLQLFRKIHTFRGESAFSSWLHRLTANVVLMSFRRRKPLTTSLDEVDKPDEDHEMPRHEIGGPDLRLTGMYDRINLQAAIEVLPEGYRLMFLLHDVHGYEHNEIAQILRCSIGNSKSQLHKARKRLRMLLSRMERRRVAA